MEMLLRFISYNGKTLNNISNMGINAPVNNQSKGWRFTGAIYAL